MKFQEILKTLLRFGSATAGLTVGSIAMSKVPSISALPPIAQKVLPGTLGMLLAFYAATKFNDENVQAAALGLGLAGFANVVKRITDGGTGIAAEINKAIPLNGLGLVNNYGAYDPSYFLNSDRVGSRLNGLGSSPYQLSGTSPYALSGVSPYQLNG